MSQDDKNIEFKIPMQILLQQIKELLESPIATRTVHNIERLVEFTKNYPFVQNDLMSQANGERTHQLVCQYMNYMYAEKDQCLFTLGEKGQYFYLILKGRVGMYIQKKDPETGDIDPYNFDRFKEFSEGQAFGELSLVSGKASIALAKCDTNCHFAVLNKNRYKNLLSIGGIKFLLNEIGFLSSLPYEKNFYEKLVKLLYLKQKILTFHKGQVVYEEGSSVNDVYLVKSGEFNKMKKITNQPEEIESYWQLPPDEICVNQRKSVSKKAPPKESNVQIGVILQKDLIGELEILKNFKKRQFTLTCYSHEGELIVIKRKDFEESLLSEESDKEYLLKRASKIQKMEEAIMKQNQIGTLYNHFFSFENAYKQNRVQSKSNVLDENPLPIAHPNKGLNTPRLQLQNSLFTARKTSLVTEPTQNPMVSSQLNYKQNLSSAGLLPLSPRKTIIFFPKTEGDIKNLNQEEYQTHRLSGQKENKNKNLSLSNIKIQTLSHLNHIESPKSPLKSSKRKLDLKLKKKNEQSLDFLQDSKQKMFFNKNKSYTNLSNIKAGYEESQQAENNNSSSTSPQKMNSYFQKHNFIQDHGVSSTNNVDKYNSDYHGYDSIKQSNYKTAYLTPEIQSSSKLQSEEYFTQNLESINRGIENTQTPFTSEFNPTHLKEIFIRQKRKSKTEIELRELELLSQIEEGEYKNDKKQIILKDFRRNVVKPRTVAGSQHIDPFVKMFHKRLQYNYFQQYGKVDLQNLKGHVMNDAMKSLPDFDPAIPSLTDIRLMIDEYLNYKNQQDIKKINQKYIQLQSNVKKINSSYQTLKQDKTTSDDGNMSKQSVSPQKIVIQMMNSTRQNQIGDKGKLPDQIFIENQQKNILPSQIINSETNIEQLKINENNLDTQKLFLNCSKNADEIEKNVKVVVSTEQIAKQNFQNETVIPKELENKKEQFKDTQLKELPESQAKTSINFHRKLEYLQFITSDHKLERSNNKKFLQLGKGESLINIKSLNQFPINFRKEITQDSKNFKKVDYSGQSSIIFQKQLKTSTNFNSLSSRNLEYNAKTQDNIQSKNKEDKQSLGRSSLGFLSARYVNLKNHLNPEAIKNTSKQSQSVKKRDDLSKQCEQQVQQKQQEGSQKKKQRIIII